MLVEDDADLLANYDMFLTRAGYAVSSFTQAATALRAAEQKLPDLALIDVGLGHDAEAGFGLCQSLRQLSATLPIVFLTARDSEADEISGLRLGADDYLVKTASLEQIQARIRAHLRRARAQQEEPATVSKVTQGHLSLDKEQKVAYWKGIRLSLAVGEFAMLALLAERPGQIKSRQQLMHAADRTVDEQTVSTQIKRIRQQILAVDDQFDSIRTVYGRGYRWLDDHD